MIQWFFFNIHQRCFLKAVLKDFAIFKGKHLRWSLFLIKLRAWKPATLSKKGLQHRCFPVNILKFLRAPILKDICERLPLLVTALVICFANTSKINNPSASSFKPKLSHFFCQKWEINLVPQYSMTVASFGKLFDKCRKVK